MSKYLQAADVCFKSTSPGTTAAAAAAAEPEEGVPDAEMVAEAAAATEKASIKAPVGVEGVATSAGEKNAGTTEAAVAVVVSAKVVVEEVADGTDSVRKGAIGAETVEDVTVGPEVAAVGLVVEEREATSELVVAEREAASGPMQAEEEAASGPVEVE